MHIIVALKQVLDPNTPVVQLRIGAEGRSIELPSGLSPVMNGYDANAVEAAVALKEKYGGSVTALSVGDETSKNALRRAVSMGADRAIHILGPTGLAADSVHISTLLAAAIRKLPPFDVILCGRQASDTDAGQVPQLLAATLDLPCVTPVKAIEKDGDTALLVDRIADGAIQKLRVELPASLGVSNEINRPRIASLKSMMLAKKADVPTWRIVDIDLSEVEPGLVLRRVTIPKPAEGRAELIAAASASAAGTALADRLRQEGMI